MLIPLYQKFKKTFSDSDNYRSDFYTCKHSIRCPIVMRLGIAWGFTIKSGDIPSHVNGMSSCLYVMPQVPFCPCRLANLSPICGIRTDRTLTLQNLKPSDDTVSITWSMIPVSLLRRNVLASLFVYLLGAPSCSSSSFSGKVIVLPKQQNLQSRLTPYFHYSNTVQ